MRKDEVYLTEMMVKFEESPGIAIDDFLTREKVPEELWLELRGLLRTHRGQTKSSEALNLVADSLRINPYLF